MLAEVGLEGKRLSTLLAGERLVVGVGLNVGPQVGLVREGLVAQITFKRSLA